MPVTTTGERAVLCSSGRRAFLQNQKYFRLLAVRGYSNQKISQALIGESHMQSW